MITLLYKILIENSKKSLNCEYETKMAQKTIVKYIIFYAAFYLLNILYVF